MPPIGWQLANQHHQLGSPPWLHTIFSCLLASSLLPQALCTVSFLPAGLSTNAPEACSFISSDFCSDTSFSAICPLATLYQQQPMSSELPVPLICFIFFQSTSTIQNSLYSIFCFLSILYILFSYLFIIHLPWLERKFCGSGSCMSGSPQQPLHLEQDCWRNGWGCAQYIVIDRSVSMGMYLPSLWVARICWTLQ